MLRIFKIHVTNFDKQEFVLGGKLQTGREGLRSLSQTRPICQLRINLYTLFKCNTIVFFKNPNFLQAGRVRFLVTRAH